MEKNVKEIVKTLSEIIKEAAGFVGAFTPTPLIDRYDDKKIYLSFIYNGNGCKFSFNIEREFAIRTGYSLHWRGHKGDINLSKLSADEITNLQQEKLKEEEDKKAAIQAELARKKEYARNCGKTAKRLKISFVNVLRLGYEDEERLMEFQKNIHEANQKLAKMSAQKRAEFKHEICICGRARKSEALSELGINTYGKDPNHMDWSELRF